MFMKSTEKKRFVYSASLIFYVVVLGLILSGCGSMLSGSESVTNKDDSAMTRTVSNPVTVLLAPIDEYREEDWEQTKSVIMKRMEVFAHGDEYYIDDLDRLLMITAEQNIFSEGSVDDIFDDYISRAYRYGLCDSETGAIYFFEDTDIKSIEMSDNNEEKRLKVKIVLQEYLNSDLDAILKKDTTEFLFSIGSSGESIPIQREKQNPNIIYLDSPERDDRYALIQYYDLTNDNPVISVRQMDFHEAEWEKDSSQMRKNLCSREELGDNITEFIYHYRKDELLSREKQEELLNILIKRLDILGYPYAIGENLEYNEIKVAFGGKVPGDFVNRLLGVNYVPSLRIGCRKEELYDQPVRLYMDSANVFTFDTSVCSNEILYTLTKDAQKDKGFVCVQMNNLPIGYSFIDTTVSDGHLLVDNILIDQDDLNTVIDLYSLNEELPTILSCDGCLTYDCEVLADLSFQNNAYEEYLNELKDSIKKDIPQLDSISVELVGSSLDYCLKIEPDQKLVDTYVRCINEILTEYPYKTSPFSQIGFTLSDEHNNILYAYIIKRYEDPFSDEDFIYGLQIDRNQVILDPYQDDLHSALDVGVKHNG